MYYIYYNLTITFFATRFGTDDLAHRILTLLQMMGAAAMAVNVTHGLGETSAGLLSMLQSDPF
jgi:low temperature requirement protein LtrA